MWVSASITPVTVVGAVVVVKAHSPRGWMSGRYYVDRPACQCSDATPCYRGDVRFSQLGRSGLTVSAVGLGCNNFGAVCDGEQSKVVIQAALDAGVTHFDCGDNYGGGQAEEILGAALGPHRRDVIIASKFGRPMPGLDREQARGSRRYVQLAIEGSLRRLNTDYLDLYYYHWPDPLTPIGETLHALDDLVRAGKVRYIACSNVQAWQVADWEWTARSAGTERFVAVQNPGNLLDRPIDAGLSASCAYYGLGLVPAFPLANGLLTGKYRRDEAAPAGTRVATRRLAPAVATFDKVDALAQFGRERGHALLDVAISGLLARPAVVSVVAGATRPEQIQANVAAGEWILSEADRQALDAIV
jgi:aryl-alcohol dehydrogenase-like predicted oxidoreductase